jgi:hypothetical protein
MKARLSKCEIVPLHEFEAPHEFGFEYICSRRRVGAIMTGRHEVAGKTRFIVRGVNVVPMFRRMGVATELYEVAAAKACSFGAPLASDERVKDAGSIQFWRKQMAKGRAYILSETGGDEGGHAAPIYSLRCPAPSSLRGRGRR